MVQTLIKLVLFMVMFGLGVGLKGEVFGLLRRRPALVARVLIGSCLVVPLLAMGLLKISMGLPLTPAARFGIALMALCPSAPLTLRKAGLMGGHRELAALLQVLAAVLAILSIPLMADLFRMTYEIRGWNIRPEEVALQVGQVQLLPLTLGLLLRRLQPSLAERISGPLDRLANGLLLTLIVLVLAKTLPALAPFMAANGLALLFMALLVLATLALGFLLAGRDVRESITVALVTSMRNPGLALLFATTYAKEMPTVKLAILAYLLVTVLLSIPFLRWERSLLARGLT